MKKILTSLLIPAALFLLPACSEKFNVAAPYKNITVIYGLLDKRDTAHYIRIQKAYLDQNKSALTMAKEPDSNFYKSLDVNIRLINTYDESIYQTIPLKRVDLDAEGYPKQPGVFFDAPNYAYKFTNTLNANYNYRLVVTNPATGETDSSETQVIEDVDNSVFHVPIIGDDTSLNLLGMDFASTNQYRYFDIYGNYNYGSNANPIGILQGFIRFNWKDSSINTGAVSSHYYDYDLDTKSLTNSGFDFQPKDLDLYSAVAVGLGKPADNFTVRLMDRCEIFIYASTNDFNSYLQAAAIAGTGLTGNEVEPTYTNIKGANALGLFTSRGYRNGKVTITQGTISALQSNSITSGTRIVGTVYH